MTAAGGGATGTGSRATVRRRGVPPGTAPSARRPGWPPATALPAGLGVALLAVAVASCGAAEGGAEAGSTGVPSPVPTATAGETVGLPAEGRPLGEPGGDTFPDVVGVTLERTAPGRFDVAVTISSPYDTPERYADAWRVVTPAGEVVGVRELAHDHADEQPFTRALPDVPVPEEAGAVVVEGRDSGNGWGGQRWQVPLP